MVHCDNDGEGQSAGERHDGGNDGADSPGELDGGWFVTFGPEQVEEEACAEDGRHKYTDEYIVWCCSNKIIIVHPGARRMLFDEVLLVDIVYTQKARLVSDARRVDGCVFRVWKVGRMM